MGLEERGYLLENYWRVYGEVVNFLIFLVYLGVVILFIVNNIYWIGFRNLIVDRG